MVSLAEEVLSEFLSRASAAGVPARAIGATGGNRFQLKVDDRTEIDLPVTEAEQIWSSGFSKHFES